MNRQWIALVVVTFAVILSLGGLALAQAGKDSGGGYVVERGTAAGGSYQLDAGAWQVQGVATGGGYRLEGLNAATGGGTPCCCVHLPCTLRDY